MFSDTVSTKRPKSDNLENYSVGSVYRRNGKLIYVISGYYTDPTYGRISNHFTWRFVKADGTLGKSGSGYGERAAPVKVKLHTTIEVL